MGIKKVFTKHFCEDCGKQLQIMSWKRCDDCDYKIYKYRQPLRFKKEKKIEIPSKTLSLHNYSTEIKGEILQEARILITDGYNIIGYKL